MRKEMDYAPLSDDEIAEQCGYSDPDEVETAKREAELIAAAQERREAEQAAAARERRSQDKLSERRYVLYDLRQPEGFYEIKMWSRTLGEEAPQRIGRYCCLTDQIHLDYPVAVHDLLRLLGDCMVLRQVYMEGRTND